MSLKFTTINSYLLFSSNFSWGKIRQITFCHHRLAMRKKHSLRILLLRQSVGLRRVILLVVTRCWSLSTTDHLQVFSSIQLFELCQLEATFFFKTGVILKGGILLGILLDILKDGILTGGILFSKQEQTWPTNRHGLICHI